MNAYITADPTQILEREENIITLFKNLKNEVMGLACIIQFVKTEIRGNNLLNSPVCTKDIESKFKIFSQIFRLRQFPK